MEAQVEQLEGDRVRLTVEVPAGDIHHAVEHATRDLAARVKVPGFRAGKVPEQVLMSRIPRQQLYTEAVESHIGSWFRSAARLNRVRPTANPQFDYELPATVEEPWSFQAEFPVQGAVAPADWTVLEVPRLEVEVPEAEVEGQLTALQGMVATLSAVEGREARDGDVAVVDMLSDDGFGQRGFVVELGSHRLVEELDDGIRSLSPGESKEIEWELADGSNRSAEVVLKELYEKVLPPLDDEVARNTSEFETLAELRSDIFDRIKALIDGEIDNQFRADAIEELLKASKVELSGLVVEWRTEELITALLRQLDQRGIDVATYLRMMGLSGADLEQRLRVEAANSIGRELVLEGVADKLGIEVSDDDIRGDLRTEGESEEDIEEFMAAGGADRVRDDLRLKRAVDRIVAEVKPISQDLAEAREKIWTPGKEQDGAPEKKLWTPGSLDKE